MVGALIYGPLPVGSLYGAKNEPLSMGVSISAVPVEWQELPPLGIEGDLIE